MLYVISDLVRVAFTRVAKEVSLQKHTYCSCFCQKGALTDLNRAVSLYALPVYSVWNVGCIVLVLLSFKEIII